MRRFIGYREVTYIQEADTKPLPYDLYRQTEKLRRALNTTKEHQEYWTKLALLTRYEIELKRINHNEGIA